MIPIYGGLTHSIETWFKSRGSKLKVNFERVVRRTLDGGEESLHYMNLKKYGVDTRERGLYVGSNDIAEALDALGETVLDAIRILVNKYVNSWRKRLSNITQYISPASGVNISYLGKPLTAVATIIPPKGILYALNIYTAAYAAGVKEFYVVSPPVYGGGIPEPILLAIKDILNYGYILKAEPTHGLSYLLLGKSFRGYFKRFILPEEYFNVLPSTYIEESILGVRPVNKICYLIDNTANTEAIVLDIYSWVELLRDAKICIVALSRSALHELIESELAIRRNALFGVYSSYIDKNVFSVLASSYNEALRIISRLKPDYVNIIVERDSMYRLIDYIRDVSIVSVGNYSLSPYMKIFSGAPLLVNINGRHRVHSVLDYVNIMNYVRIDPDAILSEYDLLEAVLRTLDQQINTYALRRLISSF